MTNKEAIETLKANYPDACYEQLREAVDIAIEALSCSENPNNSDCISRRAAIDDMCKHFNYDVHDDLVYWNREHVLRVLKDLPSAQPEIVRCEKCINHGKEICYFWSRFYGTINTPDDGFCHKADRRTDG